MSRMVDADQLADGVIITSRVHGHLLVIGTPFPPDASEGYSPGCLFLDHTVGEAYRNVGTKASSNFDVVTT